MPLILTDAQVHRLREDLTLVLSYLDSAPWVMDSVEPLHPNLDSAKAAARRIAQALPRLTGRRRAWSAGASSA